MSADNRYQIIYADPPWSYREQVQHGGSAKSYTSSAGRYYDTMTVQQLCELGDWIDEISDPRECLLFMWCTGPLLVDALAVMQAWKFRYVQIPFVWDKERVNPGAYTMTQCEYVVLGKRGRRPQPLGTRNERQLVRHMRDRHSRKPLQVRDCLDRMYPQAQKLELFARGGMLSEGMWIRYGLEVVDYPTRITAEGPVR